MYIMFIDVLICLVQVLAFEAGRKHKIRVNTISAGKSDDSSSKSDSISPVLKIFCWIILFVLIEYN